MNGKDVKANWNSMAQVYEEFTNGEDSYSNLIEWPEIKRLLPDINGKKVVDLGCGTGRFSFLLEELGPREVNGIDLSEEMIKIGEEIGRTKESKVNFNIGDISDLRSIEEGSADVIFSSTTFHYVPDLNKLMKEIYRVLKSGGTGIFSVIHPVYSAQYPISHEDNSLPEDNEWEVKYLDKSIRAYVQPWIEFNSEIEDYLSYSYHYTMSDYISSILKSGLKIVGLSEPMPPQKWKQTSPGRYYGFINTPTYAIFKVTK